MAEEMANVVYGSNIIERVGVPDLNETRRICWEIYMNQRGIFEDEPPRSSAYEAALESAIDAGQVNRSRRDRQEVANHAAAFVYMTNKVVKSNEPFGDQLIRETHRILCNKVDADNGDTTRPYQDYAGLYRSIDGRDNVMAGNTGFVRASKVASAMTRFIEELNETIRMAEKEQTLDPFFIAAHACGEFVNIHPFIDGNGRPCRLILNTILLKYAGIVAPIGEDQAERKEYLSIPKRRSTDEDGNGALSSSTVRKSLRRLKEVTAKLVIEDEREELSLVLTAGWLCFKCQRSCLCAGI
ncbi:uncharacterized protein LTR77_008594 [Saxophila tyrrhenica]|uniref:Fido domain-containing protein n=1 Tax=Saxophila tyrrhenica TaxID=1690608 RepID=A0AAV9P5F0_9PEZI|nr:hypothetical protein LTR77_008594 [Saxophila tyrrhenica]